MALAVGILVDDATVAIENIHRNIGQKKPFVQRDRGRRAGDRRAGVRVDVVHLHRVRAGRVHHRRGEVAVRAAGAGGRVRDADVVLSVAHARPDDGPLSARGKRSHHGARAQRPRASSRHSIAASSRLRDWLRWLARVDAGASRPSSAGSSRCSSRASLLLMPLLGRDFFPSVDAGLIKLHVRGAPGMRTRGNRAAHRRDRATRFARSIPPDEIETMLDNIGVPNSGINLSLSEGALISPADAQILISLKDGHAPTADYVRELRQVLHKTYPETTFFFLAPDISTQVLNFGLAAPIDVQVVGAIGSEDRDARRCASNWPSRCKTIPGAVDVHLAQVSARTGARDQRRSQRWHQQAGLTRATTSPSDLLVSLSSSGQVAPSYWLDTKRGVQYLGRGADAAVRRSTRSTPSTRRRSRPVEAQATAARRTSRRSSARRGPANITHSNVARTYDVQATSTARTSAPSVMQWPTSSRRRREAEERCRAAPSFTIKGQVESMESVVSAASARVSCSPSCSSTC